MGAIKFSGLVLVKNKIKIESFNISISIQFQYILILKTYKSRHYYDYQKYLI